jgi:hypothetical protein
VQLPPALALSHGGGQWLGLQARGRSLQLRERKCRVPHAPLEDVKKVYSLVELTPT